jgi:hypothetical protein
MTDEHRNSLDQVPERGPAAHEECRTDASAYEVPLVRITYGNGKGVQFENGPSAQ